MKPFHLLLLLAALALALAGCGRMQAAQPAANPNFVITMSVQPEPAAVGPAQVLVKLTDRAGKPVEGAHIRVEGDMTHAGMTPVIAEASGGQAGQYVVPLKWTMGGDWMIDVTATLPDGQVARQQFPLRVKE